MECIHRRTSVQHDAVPTIVTDSVEAGEAVVVRVDGGEGGGGRCSRVWQTGNVER